MAAFSFSPGREGRRSPPFRRRTIRVTFLSIPLIHHPQLDIRAALNPAAGGRKGRSDMDREKWTRFATDAEAKAEGDTSRVLVTMLFTDLVGSTELAVELGDRRWRALLERHHTIVRELLDQFRGREVDCAGDGFFATFETATPAVHCGFSLTRSLQSLGLEVRVGLHTGECERFGQKVSGVAVHTAARLSRIARPGEVLVTGTVKDVVAGSGLRFEERDTHTLKGLPGGWQLFAAVGLDLDDSRHGGRDHGLSIRGTRSEVHRAPVKSGVA